MVKKIKIKLKLLDIIKDIESKANYNEKQLLKSSRI